MRLLRVSGIGVTVAFIFSLIVLFTITPQTYDELDYLGITSFNIEGFSLRLQVVLLNYALPGVLIVLFATILSTYSGSAKRIKYGSYLIILSGLAWGSFGVYPIEIDGFNGVFGVIHMVKITVCWLSGIIGLLLISIDFDRIFRPRYLRWVTIVTGSLMLLESIYFIMGEWSGKMSAIAWSVYMSWFFIFSLRISMKSLSPN